MRWVDVEKLFGMRPSALSEDFWEVFEAFTDDNDHLLELFRLGLLQKRVSHYSEAVHRKGAPLMSCGGLIDCTKVQMSGSGGTRYSGHERFHSLIFHTIITSDGLLFYLYFPELGKRHDMNLYRESLLEAAL